MSDQENGNGKQRRRPGFWRRVLVILVVLFLALLSISFIVHIPVVQNWGINQISKFISKKTDTQVEVGSFDLNLFRHIRLKDLNVIDPFFAQDTLIHSGSLYIRFDNLLSLFRNRLPVREVVLQDARIHIRRTEEHPDNTMTEFLERLFDKKSNQDSTASNQIAISPHLIILEEVFVNFVDEIKASDQKFAIQQGQVALDEIDFETRKLFIDYVEFSDPIVEISKQKSAYQPASRSKDADLKSDSLQKAWEINVNNVFVDCGHFIYDDWNRQARSTNRYLDYAHLNLKDIQIAFQNLLISDTAIATVLERMSCVSTSGFVLDELSGNIVVDDKEIKFENLNFKTPQSRLGQTVRFRKLGENAFADFTNRVILTANLSESRLAAKDLLQLVPGLEQNAFFAQNQNEVFRISGVITGRINRLKGKNVDIALSDISMKGNFGTRNLSDPEKTLVNLDLTEANFNFNTIKKLAPGLNIPENFFRLGNIRFGGRFDGYLQNFVAYGNFDTELGKAGMDMNLDFRDDPSKARYSGSAKLIGFDLGNWSANPDFGEIAMTAEVRDGVGLTPESATAELIGVIELLDFKDYSYENIQLNATLQKSSFDGALSIVDENIALDFTGRVNFEDTIPDLDFYANIEQLDLQALNLSESPFAISGVLDIDIVGLTIENVEGVAIGRNVLFEKDTTTLSLDTFAITSSIQNGIRNINLYSNILEGYLKGEAPLVKAHLVLANHIKNRFSPYLDKWNIQDSLGLPPQDFEFAIRTSDITDLLIFLNLGDLDIDDLTANGHFSSSGKRLFIDLAAGEVHYSDFNAYSVIANMVTDSTSASMNIGILASDIKQEMIFEEIGVNGRIFGDSIEVQAESKNLPVLFDNFKVKALAHRSQDDIYSIHFVPKSLVALDSVWNLDPQNRIILGKDLIQIDNFILHNAEREIELVDIRNKGVRVSANGFDLRIIDALWDDEKVDFSGSYTLDAAFYNIFDTLKRRLDLHLFADQMFINSDSFGRLDIKVDQPSFYEAANIGVVIDGKHAQLAGTGKFFPPLKSIPESDKNNLSLNFDIQKFPMSFFEYFLVGGISNTKGFLEGDIQIAGPLSEINFSGKAKVLNGATTVNYLGTRYTFNYDNVILSNTMVDLTGAKLYDSQDNAATITGGLTHMRFGKWGVNATIRSPNFISLNTTREDNPLYYGLGIGALNAQFQGLFIRPNITVNATSGPGTYLAIPIEAEIGDTQVNFIEFQSRDSVKIPEDEEDDVLPKGVNIDIDLAITNDATIEIIFNERSGDIIRGNGRGDVQIGITRTGEFTVFGNYEIDKGNYLFTNTILNKPFEIQRGGTIQWVGDPFDAQIDIHADYIGLRTNLTTFLEEYLVNASVDAKSEAASKTDVALTLLLTGSLLQPQINFAIDFPDVAGELAGYADSKLRILEANQNALNEQVFGLLWIGSFLPSNVLQSGTSTTQLATSGLSNTLSEFLTNQLSLFLSDFLERAVADVGFISGVDLDIGVSRNYDIYAGEFYSSEWEVSLRNRLFDDRFVIDVGGNYVTDSPIVTEGEYFAWDYALEYILTKDRRLKVRFYNRNEQTIEGRKNKLGIGLSYRREFDTFGEFLRGVKTNTEKLTEDSGSGN